MARLLCVILLLVVVVAVFGGTAGKADSKGHQAKQTPSRSVQQPPNAASKVPGKPAQSPKSQPAGKSLQSGANIQPTFSCAGQDFKGVTKCCQKPALEFFAKGLDLTCNNKKRDDASFAFAKEFVLNRHQDLRTNSVLFSNSATVKAVAPAACIVECMFKSESLLMVNGSVDFALARSYLAISGPAEWREIVKGVVDVCKQVVVGYPSHALPNPSKPALNCSLDPLLLVQCIFKNVVTSCPSQKVQSSPRCKSMVSNLARCDGSLTTTTEAPTTSQAPTSTAASSSESGASVTSVDTTTAATAAETMPNY